MRRKVIEDHVHHDRWLVSYADFITLLFAFFVVMYSISQVSESKYKVLSSTLTEAFHQQVLIIDPIQVGKPAKAQFSSPIDLQAIAKSQNEGNSDGGADGKGGGEETGELPEQFKKITKNVEEVLGDLLKSKMIHLRGNEEWLAVEMNSSLLFGVGDAQLSTPAMEILTEIVSLLKGTTNPIRVEGFTDNIPISNEFFDSNWELSTSRAAAVVKLFVEEGIKPNRLAAIGYGEFQPVVSNDTAEGREKNRRVVLMISKTDTLRPELPDVALAKDFVEQDKPDPNNPLQGVKTIVLDGGGLLFTSEKLPSKPQ